MQKVYLHILVFATGAVTLGVELSAARLLEPAFGNNQIVWSALIGLILFYLAVGAWLGGKLADRYPVVTGIDSVVTVGAVGVALIPLFSGPVLRLAAIGLGEFAPELLVGALLAVLLLFSIPVILLGTVSPWALRLLIDDISHSGQTAGWLYATATTGSLVGTFAPVLWLIPTFGTRWTFILLALLLLLVVLLGSLRYPHRWVPLVGLGIVLLIIYFAQPGAGICQSWDDGKEGQIIYEDESLYNYIAVRQWESERHLKLNDGTGIHSVYHPQVLLSHGIWDYFLLAPLFNAPPVASETLPNMLLIGLAAGTISELYTNLYGPIPITGIELDPQIIEVGRTYFAMNQPNLDAIAADGRRWLQQQPKEAKWALVAIDAYRPPYIPFHLATVEFFQLVRDHLTADGIVAINVGRTDENFALVDVLSATLGQVFPSVHIIDEPGPPHMLANSLVVATMQPTRPNYLAQNVAGLSASLPIEFRQFAQTASTYVRVSSPPPGTPLLTDDRAPIEQVVHSIAWDFFTR